MTLGDHASFFEREIASLGKESLNLSFETIIKILRDQGSHEADAACRVFAKTLHWPPVPDEVRIELCMRLDCARWWCKLNEISDEPIDDEEPGPEFLESLLIDYWLDVGRRDWLWENYCLNAEERAGLGE
jgi:hypothetical protein